VETVQIFGNNLTNQNYTLEEIKNRLNAESTCYCSLQNVLSSSLLFKNIKIKAYGTIVLPAVLYGCETWSLIFREECRLGVFKNEVLRRIIGPKTDKVQGSGENYIMSSLMICTPYQMLFR
jgi:hypothetical protein